MTSFVPSIEVDLGYFRPASCGRSLPCTLCTTPLPASLIVYVPQYA
jgi:hypothetical protein